jgi:alpha-glucoside transport system permease protein
MSADAATVAPGTVRRRGPVSRAARALASGPARYVLLIVGALWLVPSFGLLVASFRPAQAQDTGWWNVLTEPSQLTIRNYVELIGDVDVGGDVAMAMVIAVVAIPALIAAGTLSARLGTGRWGGMILGGLAALAQVVTFGMVADEWAVVIAIAAIVTLVAAGRVAFEARRWGRLAVTVGLVLLVEIVALIPEGSGMLGALRNSVLITVPTSALLVLVAASAAYAFAWTEFRGRDLLFLVVVGLLVVPIQIGLIPVADLYGKLGLFGTIPGVVLYHVAFGLPFAVFLLRNFFIGIPGELLEAARMDGASEWRVFSRVVLPLGLPAIASLLIFQFLWVWNDLLIALVFAGSDARPLTVAIQQQLRAFGGNIDVIAPGSYLQMIVPLLVFFAFQRYFVQGLLAGSQR